MKVTNTLHLILDRNRLFLCLSASRVQDQKVTLDMKSPPWALKGRNPSAHAQGEPIRS